MKIISQFAKAAKILNLASRFGLDILILKRRAYRSLKKYPRDHEKEKANFDRLYQAEYKFIKKRVNNVLNTINERPDSQVSVTPTRTIWFCWFQGIDSAPEVVKRCYTNAVKYSQCTVNLITIENLSDYIVITPELIDRFNSGDINKANFSDYIRFSLLEKHGGLWIDATCLIVDRVPDYVFSDYIYYPKGIKPFDYHGGGAYQFPYIDEFVTYCVASHPEGLFVQFMKESIEQMLISRDNEVDYLFAFVLAKISRDHFKKVRQEHESIVCDNVDCESLSKFMNLSPTDEKLKHFLKDSSNWMYKLTAKESDRNWRLGNTLWDQILKTGKLRGVDYE